MKKEKINRTDRSKNEKWNVENIDLKKNETEWEEAEPDEEWKELEAYIRAELDEEEVAEGLLPENMKRKLLETQAQKEKSRKTVKRRYAVRGFAAAACAVIVVTAGLHRKETGFVLSQTAGDCTTESAASGEKLKEAANEAVYEAIYEAMDKSWVKEEPKSIWDWLFGSEETEDTTGAATESAMADGAAPENAGMGEIMVEEAETETGAMEKQDYAGTNVQVAFVDEGDIVKNDGRYLYQLVRDKNYSKQQIQIVDTKEGLKELSRIEGFQNVDEFYIYEDTVVVIENLWAGFQNTAFSKIYMYDISDRSRPKELHTFTIRGSYKTSRIADGYFYFFTGYDTSRPESKKDLEKYIPMVDGKLLDAKSLYLPDETDATSYLVMVSVDLANPTAFTDKMAVVTWGNYYYVSTDNIYILDNQDVKLEEGLQWDKTNIIKLSYKKGQIELVCEGEVDGSILDQFAMDEYKGYLRLVTTKSPQKYEMAVDDLTGKELGVYEVELLPESNNVYVLDEALKVVGAIENLAEDERVYSARFMGDTGYFVTFRQVDPLFSVDFSNPKQPKILGELKISGFSEYLHFYGDNLLLGIGYEADEETGGTEGIKLSMFDISDPSDVKEINKCITDYDYSEALYNHHAVLVSAGKNVIGFMAEDYDKETENRVYTAYAYNGDKGFLERFAIDCSPAKENGYAYYEGRGTYIGDTFYLLMQDGSVRAYDLETGQLTDALKAAETKQ